MLTYSAQPDTVEEVQTEIQNWFGGRSNEKRICTFSRTPRESALNIFISYSSRDLKVEMVGRCLFFQVKQKRLSLNLDKFLIRTAFKGEKLSLHIDRDPALDHHFLASMLRQFTTTKHPAFYTRVLRAVKSLEDDLTNASIDEATAAPTDHLVMLEAVSSARWVSELASEDPLVAAKLRGLKLRQEMLMTAGGALTSNQLLALTQGKRGYSYPGFQFHDGKTLKGLEAILGALSALDPWMQLNFFTNPNERLGKSTPIEALRDGKVDDVVRVASAYGEQGAL
jgi:hypothetical protein